MVPFISVTQFATSLLLYSIGSECLPNGGYSSSPAADTDAAPSTGGSSQVKLSMLVTCNVEGTASDDMHQRHKTNQPSFIGCQNNCFFDTACQSYSYNPTTEDCITYMAPLIVTPGSTGNFFSQKYPGDGSNYCYGSTGY